MGARGPISHGGQSGASLGGRIVGKRRKRGKDSGVPKAGPVTVTINGTCIEIQQPMTRKEVERVIRKGERRKGQSGGSSSPSGVVGSTS